MKTDIEIARAARLLPIADIAERIGAPTDAVIPYGRLKAKLDKDFIKGLAARPEGRLILVTAMNPTPAGEGKTTTTIGLGDALNRIGRQTIVALREPSLGPCFGVKGGATGGGLSQVAPMEDINLHFTGDFHAVTAAHNLLAAMLDNHIHWGNDLKIDPRRLEWRRALDMNDRALRQIVTGLGGAANGSVAETGFDITVASEVMAILCLATDLKDLQRRLGDIIVGWNGEGEPVTARDLKADGAMTALLADAIQPNLVQTLENNPALIHGGPFANIAHGCNSIIATKAALRLGDFVVTEAGFGADLGAEKFFNIKCRAGDFSPSVVVVVATVRSLKMHGGVPRDRLNEENVSATVQGCANLGRHLQNIAQFGAPAIVAINRFGADTEAELSKVKEFVAAEGARAILCTHWSDGSAGAEDLAREVVRIAETGSERFQPLYRLDLPLEEKIRTIAQRIYGARDIAIDASAQRQLAKFERLGFGRLPVCMAKTQSSLSADPALLGAPEGHITPIRSVRLAAGAGFVVALCGDVMTMPGLPKRPAAERIGVGEAGFVEGLF